MKDGSDVTTACSNDGRTLLSVPSTLDNGFLESGSLGLQKDCDAASSSPEATNTWGDFESFNEFTPQADQLVYEDGAIEEDILVTTIAEGDCGTNQTHREGQWNAFNLGNENRQECERIFRLGFPAVPVEDTNDDVKSLEELMSNEENLSQLIKTRLWLEGDLSCISGDGMSTKSGCEWQNSKGCRDLMTLLGSTTENSSNNGGKADDALTDITGYFNESTPPGSNKYLIQTKLDIAPGSKSAYISSYQLVLKKSSDVSVPFLTFSGKKSFFSANQLRFNF
ncbi:uncharacterized protein LOC130295283 [Hyla sarda]|uniref:uncharacterized protein LOC130295283 n=1 Tax=Hyla sarda TaxID=327740 RepID=UPI0024C2419D|nr:uncharacterized protein LOC130295283 [Hyla sarda]XP_056401869.1 uncharacterized protein LOC130295283 [Hyla sarda]XP_056401870.1 uncharacterized protein LOC130295283 [Hyla sarda]